MLVTNPSMVIELQGHTDSQGDDKQNQKLSEDRAKAVRDALIAKGINGSRMTAKGYGETVPIADNASEEGRAKNRRTVFVVVTQ
jgi:outer membrane protein OmpA-like peptidoglycan-associated protein